MAYVYRHIRLDTNEVFYIGIGSDNTYKRAHQYKKRNDYWKNIVNITKYKVEIVFDNLNWKEACKKEIRLIKLYGRKDLNQGSLCNMTNGGEGYLGGKYSDKIRLKMSNLAKERFKKEKHCRKGKLFILKSSKKVVIIDLKDYIIYNFNSIVEASLYIKRSSQQVRNACIQSENDIKRSVNGYFVKFGETISNDIINTLKSNILIDISSPIHNKRHNTRKVINTITNKEYSCIKDIIVDYPANYHALYGKLTGYRKNNTPFKFI